MRLGCHSLLAQLWPSLVLRRWEAIRQEVISCCPGLKCSEVSTQTLETITVRKSNMSSQVNGMVREAGSPKPSSPQSTGKPGPQSYMTRGHTAYIVTAKEAPGSHLCAKPNYVANLKACPTKAKMRRGRSVPHLSSQSPFCLLSSYNAE